MECKASFQKLARPVTREWLETKYVSEGLDCVQIAQLVSRDPKSVWNWLRDFGIPTRSRGSDPRQQFAKGAPNAFAGRRHSAETREKMRSIAIAEGRVPFDPAVGSYMKGRRGDQHPMWKGGITPDRPALYASPEWADAVKVVWARGGAKCERCGAHHNTAKRRGTFHIHHIVSFAVEHLRAEPNNLALLCIGCHHFVHSRANVSKEFIKGA